MRKDRSFTGVFPREQIITTMCLLLIAGLAWAYLFRLDHEMGSSAGATMAGMEMAADQPWTLSDFFFTFAMWSVMMIAMMVPAAAPILFLVIGAASRSRRTNGVAFAAGHTVVWVGFSAIAASLQWMLHRADWLSPDMALTNSVIAGLVLVVAGLYQLSQPKSECLTRCQSPVGFFMSNWQDGSRGALRLGIKHGLLCLGCCWALMLVLFVVGVMNLAWVGVLTLFILIEKFGAQGMRLARAAGVALTGIGILYIAIVK